MQSLSVQLSGRSPIRLRWPERGALAAAVVLAASALASASEEPTGVPVPRAPPSADTPVPRARPAPSKPTVEVLVPWVVLHHANAAGYVSYRRYSPTGFNVLVFNCPLVEGLPAELSIMFPPDALQSTRLLEYPQQHAFTIRLAFGSQEGKRKRSTFKSWRDGDRLLLVETKNLEVFGMLLRADVIEFPAPFARQPTRIKTAPKGQLGPLMRWLVNRSGQPFSMASSKEVVDRCVDRKLPRWERPQRRPRETQGVSVRV